MNPETVKKLQENVPELRELVAFLAAEAEKLNTLADLGEFAHNDIAVEVIARKRAYDTIQRMLSPLLDVQESGSGIDVQEYVV